MRATQSPRLFRGLGFLVVLSLILALAGCGESGDTSEAETINVSLLIYAGDDDSRWFRDVEVPKGTNDGS